MKRILAIALSCLLLVGCAPVSPAENPPLAETIVCKEELVLYLPDDNAEYFKISTVPVPAITETAILTHLKCEDVLKDGVSINSFSQEGKALALDFNQAFAQQVGSMGTAGEYMIMGSVVNTFLTAFEADCIRITVEGQAWETGHSFYDEPLYFYE